jgi:hypothetical protein
LRGYDAAARACDRFTDVPVLETMFEHGGIVGVRRAHDSKDERGERGKERGESPRGERRRIWTQAASVPSKPG